MRVTRVRLVLLLLIGVVLVMFTSSNENSLFYEPVKSFQIAQTTTEYKADLFTDVAIEWTDEANAYDGDWGTYAYDLSVAGGDDYPSNYASNFDSANSGTGTISQVDIVIRLSVLGLAGGGNGDSWGITLDVSTSTDNELRAHDTSDYSLNNLTFSDVTEPNGGGWTWAEVWAAQVHFDTERRGGSDNADVYIYEYAFKVTAVSGTDYDAFLYDSTNFDDTANFVESFMQNLYDSTNFDDTANFVVSFIQNLFESISVAGTTGLIGSFVKSLFESLTFVGTLTPSILLLTFLYDSFVVSGTATIAIGYTVLLFGGIVVSETLNIAGVFELSIYESFVVVADLNAQKITQLFKNIFESFAILEFITVVATSVVGLLFYQLFLSMNMWSYLGPIALVIGGYFVSKKNVNLGILWFMVECLVVAQYFALLDATPDYWWHIFILLLGGLLTCVYPLWGKE